MKPLVSVLLPNLNNRLFLEERIASIRNQTWENWELVIVDNFSEDGAWDFFQEIAKTDTRIRISQAPRQGMYANWNNCLNLARGEYFYIATSDDNMAQDCLERLVDALERHPECGLAHCRLKMFDSKGADVADWWSRSSVFVLSSGALKEVEHVRLAPFDGLLHLTGASVYTSITQLLIRKSVFDRVGRFESQWGSMGDFNWNMRAGLVVNTVHVPGTWAGWRIHPQQATAASSEKSTEYWNKIDQMIDHAVHVSEQLIEPRYRDQLMQIWAGFAQEARELHRESALSKGLLRRQALLLKHFLGGSKAARVHVKARFRGQAYSWLEAAPSTIADWLRKSGLNQVLLPSDVSL